VRGWLLDTNVISELRKPRCDDRVRAWTDARPPESLYLSAVTLAEIRFGIERQPDPVFRTELETWLDANVRPWFAGRILEVDEDVILEWRRMVARGREANHTFSQPDLFIAATAARHELCVVTRNAADFEKAGVAVLNPWKA
jgi:predicted nucleic acid-binding protein